MFQIPWKRANFSLSFTTYFQSTGVGKMSWSDLPSKLLGKGQKNTYQCFSHQQWDLSAAAGEPTKPQDICPKMVKSI